MTPANSYTNKRGTTLFFIRLRVSTPCLLFSLACLYSLTFSAQASDILKEQRWASQIEDNLVVGNALHLKAGDREFLCLFTPASGKQQRGGVILLHGMGAHPDWPDVISPLRKELPEAGWATLALQMPVLPNDAKADEYIPLYPEANERITAGILYLQQQGIHNIVIVGHSLGSTMGLNFLAAKAPGSEQVRAYVGIGIGRHSDGAPGTESFLSQINLPVLDFYGSQDLGQVVDLAEERAAAAKRVGNSGYRQIKIAGADHFFQGYEHTLVKRISSWLSKVAPGREIKSSEINVPIKP